MGGPIPLTGPIGVNGPSGVSRVIPVTMATSDHYSDSVLSSSFLRSFVGSSDATSIGGGACRTLARRLPPLDAILT